MKMKGKKKKQKKKLKESLDRVQIPLHSRQQ